MGDGGFDRVYLAEQFAAYFASFIGNGVFGSSMQKLEVLAQTEPDMSVKVLSGEAWINGWWYHNTAEYTLQLDIADGVLSRIDAIVVRWGNQERDIWLHVIKGTPSANPVAPTISRDADYYDLQLGTVLVSKGAVKITQSAISDTRLNNAVCGLVTGVVDQIDTTDLYNQFTTYFNEFKEQYQGEFETWTDEKKVDWLTWIGEQEAGFTEWYNTNTTQWESDWETWFQSIQDQLSGDIATNLASQIGTLSQLKTTFKDSLVGAVNELYDTLGSSIKYEKDTLSLMNRDGEVLSSVNIISGAGIKLAEPTAVSAVNNDESVKLTWTDPSDVTVSGATVAKWDGTVVVRKAGSAPTNKNDGVIVVDSKTRNQYKTTPFTDSGLSNGTTYYYGFFPYTEQGNYTTTKVVSVNVAAIYPSAVSGVTVKEEDKKLTITFTKPSNATTVKCVYKTGSAPANSGDGTVLSDFTSGSSITGLTNNTTYYLKLYTYNAKGRETASSAYSGTPTGLKIVTWADGTAEEIDAMLQAHYANKINVKDYWALGDARVITLPDFMWVDTRPSSGSKKAKMIIIGFDHDTLASPINGHAKAAVTVYTSYINDPGPIVGYYSLLLKNDVNNAVGSGNGSIFAKRWKTAVDNTYNDFWYNFYKNVPKATNGSIKATSIKKITKVCATGNLEFRGSSTSDFGLVSTNKAKDVDCYCFALSAKEVGIDLLPSTTDASNLSEEGTQYPYFGNVVGPDISGYLRSPVLGRVGYVTSGNAYGWYYLEASKWKIVIHTADTKTGLVMAAGFCL